MSPKLSVAVDLS